MPDADATGSAPAPELDTRFSGPGATPTPWADVRAAIDGAELFWISTVRPDGRPHVTPLPAVWDDGVLYFCTGADEQKGRNLARDPHCVLTTGTNEWKSGLDVMVEGGALQVVDDELLRRLAQMWASKYQGEWQFEVVDGRFRHGPGDALVFAVAPTKVLAFAKGVFAQTRFRFTAGPS